MEKLQKNISKKNKVFIYSCTCHRRDLDAKKISRYFILNNYQIVNDPKDAYYIIFFTCAFVNELSEKCFKMIKELQKYDAELIVAGCLPDIEKEELSKMFNGKILPAKNMEIIDEIFKDNKIKFKDIDDENIIWKNYNPIGIEEGPFDLIRNILQKSTIARKIEKNIIKKIIQKNRVLHEIFFPEFSDRYLIMVSRGCTKNCSYCAIKKAIGPLISKPVDQCVKEFQKGLNLGNKNFVITADDIGAYGLDINSNFSELLDKITSIKGDYNIELQGLNPVWTVKYVNELEEILKKGKIKIIICPIQSGSSRILKLMRRYHDTEKMKEVFLRIKNSFPDLSLETNYLVGFPTESKEDVEKTLSFIKQVNFDVCYIFPFSCKSDTEAAKLDPKVQKQEIFKRLKYAKRYLKNVDIPVYIVK